MMPTKTPLLSWEEQAEVLKVLGDKTRLQMMAFMMHHEMCVCEFVDIFSISQPAVSQHVRRLKSAKLIRERRQGLWVFYSIHETSETYIWVKPIIEQLPDMHSQIKQLEQRGVRVSCGGGEMNA